LGVLSAKQRLKAAQKFFVLKKIRAIFYPVPNFPGYCFGIFPLSPDYDLGGFPVSRFPRAHAGPFLLAGCRSLFIIQTVRHILFSVFISVY
jgi:hypothetical protein